ncbi:uncharacterized protein [Haliotis cracherodii]|uniref:uncharacterized protein n=1 Tax=Haliotis cracherodii TaxID=6455 RepID=UPI0039ECFDD1
MITVNVASIVVAVFFLVIQVAALTLDTEHASPVQKRDTSKLDMSALRTALDGIDTDLQSKQKRTCAIGINSHHCALASMDDRMLSREWLNNGYSPGKRDGGALTPDMHSEAERELEQISLKRQAIATLKYLLLKIKQKEIQPPPRKRSCSLRLGGLCLTESLDRAASQYYYLRSPHSPGRRRRDLNSHLTKP